MQVQPKNKVTGEKRIYDISKKDKEMGYGAQSLRVAYSLLQVGIAEIVASEESGYQYAFDDFSAA